MIQRLVVLLMLSNVLGATAWAQAVPPRISFTGNLADGGGPLSGNHTFAFALFDAATAGTRVWSENAKTIAVTNGLVFTELGSTTAFNPTILNGAPVWLEITVDSTVMSPRLAFVSVPFAIRAAVAASAETLGTFMPTDFQRRVTGVCASGIASIDAAGGATCATGGSGITAVTTTAGSGLTSSVSSGTATISLAPCLSGQVLKSNAGAWSCQADTDTGVNAVTPGAGLTASITNRTLTIAPQYGAGVGTITQGNDPRLPPAPASAGSLLVDNGSAWVAQPSSTAITSVGTLSSLSVSGNVTIGGNISFPSPKTLTLAIPAASFTGTTSAATYGSNWIGGNDRYVNTLAGNDTLIASVTLPQGAKITALNCRVLASDSTKNVQVALVNFATNGLLCGFFATSTPLLALQTVGGACSPFTVDNASQFLGVRYNASGKCAVDTNSNYGCALSGCFVTYTVSGVP